MKLKVSKVMVKALNSYAKEKGYCMRYDYREANPETYKLSVNMDVFGAYDWGDYNEKTGNMKYIAVIYPPEYYAVPGVLTTEELNKLFTGADYNGYMENVMQATAI